MPRIDTDEWITSTEAATILTRNSGHTVTDNYVRRLAFTGAIRKRMLHERLSLYSRADVERYKVQKRPSGKKKESDNVIQSAEAVVRSAKSAADFLNMLTVEDRPLREMLTEEQFSEAVEKLRQAIEPSIREYLAANPEDE